MRNIVHTLLLIMIIFIISIVLISNNTKTKAAELIKPEISEYIEGKFSDIDVNNLNKEEILKIYDEVFAKYPMEVIADETEEYLKGETGDKMASFIAGYLRQIDTKALRNIIEEDIDFDTYNNRVKNGELPSDVVNDMINSTLIIKLILIHKVIKKFLMIILFTYLWGSIVRAIIYKKLGKSSIAAFIPIYRDVVMFQACGLSGWNAILCLFFYFLFSIFGFIIGFIYKIVLMRNLSEKFNKKGAFTVGLILLPIVFETILAFSGNNEYEIFNSDVINEFDDNTINRL